MKYTERTLRAVQAARYRHGQPLGELLEVARSDNPAAAVTEVDDWAAVTEVDEWGCLLVRYVHDGLMTYLVVSDGEWLVADDGGELSAWSDGAFRYQYTDLAAGPRR